MAFKIAGSMAFKQAAAEADPYLLEPIVKTTIGVPEDTVGDVVSPVGGPLLLSRIVRVTLFGVPTL